MTRRRYAPWVVIGAAVLCAAGYFAFMSTDDESADHPASPLDVAFDGCTRITRGPICHVTPDTVLVLWSRAPAGTELEVVGDGRRLEELEIQQVDDGLQIRVATEGASTLEMRASSGARWRLLLKGTETNPELGRADELRRRSDFDEALAILSPLIDDERPSVRARAIGMTGRIHLARSEIEPAIARLREAIALDATHGLLFEEARDRFALAYLLQEAWRFSEAQSVLHAGLHLHQGYPGARSQHAYYEALVVSKYGDLGAAQARFEEAITWARRLGQAQLAKDAIAARINVLLRLGRNEEVAHRLDDVAREANATSGCDRANVLNNIGFYATMNGESGRETRPLGRSAIDWLRDAKREFEEHCPDHVSDHANVLQSLAREHARRGEGAEASALLDNAERMLAQPSGKVFVERRVLRALLALLEGRPQEALSTYEWLERFGRAGDSTYYGWIAAVGRARSLVALGRRREAIVALQEAERMVERALTGVPLGEGRYRSGSLFLESATLAIELLLEAGHVEEAAEVARRSRRRGLAALGWIRRIAALGPAERTRWYAALATYRRGRSELEDRSSEDWNLASSDLEARTRQRHAARLASQRALQSALSVLGTTEPFAQTSARPPPGELLLIWHRATTGHVLFAIDDRDAFATRITEGTSWVEAVAPRLERATTIRLRAASNQLDVDLRRQIHAAVPEGARIEYFLDLPNVDRGVPIPDSPATALVVADPRNDLRAARKEGEIVADALRSAGFEVTLLSGSHADFVTVRTAIERSTIARMHYAGHATFGGVDGAESGLELADGARLTLTDILALERVPAHVTLSGCETGRNDGDRGAGMSIAEAFLIAGAERALASTRTIDDLEAVEAFRALYEGGVEADAALRHAGFRAIRR